MAVNSLSADFGDLLLDDVEPTGVELGRGSFGLVFEVKRHGEVFAAKKLHDFFFESDTPSWKRVEEFTQECLTWAKLEHPNMVALRGLYRDYSHGTPVIHIVMERMDVSLGDYLLKNPRETVPLHKKVCILLQVAQGLSYLHGQLPPLVHHDLKPDNIMLNTSNFTAKLTDFGMIRTIFRSSLTRMSSVKGTPVFMPPEAMNEPPKYDEKLDVFSYGCVIISTLLHSKAPIPTGPTKMINGQLSAVSECDRRKHHMEQFTAVEKSVFLHIVEKCLEFDPTKRPSSSALVQEMTLIVAQPCITQEDTQQSQDANEALITNLQANLGNTQSSLTILSAEREALSNQCQRLQNQLSDTSSSLQQSQVAMEKEMEELHALRDDCLQASNLPEGWTATFAPNGRIVYASHREKKTQWTHPRTGKPSAMPPRPRAAQRQMSEPIQSERQIGISQGTQFQSMPSTLSPPVQPPPPAQPQPAPPPAAQTHSAPPPPTQPHPAPPPYTPVPDSALHGVPSTSMPYLQYMGLPLQHQGVGYGPGYHGNHSHPMGYQNIQMPYPSMSDMPVSTATSNPKAVYEGGGPPLARGWETRHTPDGQRYYANHITGETTWNRPSS